MKKIYLAITIVIFILPLAVLAQTMKADRSPCDAIKGKSYLGWNAGKFDDNPDTVNSHKIVFDASGKGKTREFFVINMTSSAAQLTRTIVCKVNSTKGDLLSGKSYLEFSDGSTLYITSYDNGSKIWGEVPTEGRKTKGWLLQLPETASENLIK